MQATMALDETNSDRTISETQTANKNLCVRCQIIFDIFTQILLCWDRIPAALSEPTTGRRLLDLKHFLINFGILSLSQTATCEFCVFVMQFVRSTIGRDIPERQEEVVVLLCVDIIGKVEPQPNFNVTHDNAVKWRKALSFGFYDVKCASMLPAPGTVFTRENLNDSTLLDDYFLVSVARVARLIDTDGAETRRINRHRTDAAESHLLLGSARLRPALCDPNMFARWLSVCDKLHGRKCNHYKRQIRHPIRLLNTSTLHLHTFAPDSMPRYFALSYVCGTEKYLHLEEANFSEVANRGFRHDANFHPSAADAIALMKAMKETYLWVDSLCIVEDRDTDKLAQIYQMDSIYSNATLTIVAAGDGQGGLPGLRKLRTEISIVQAGALMLIADACASSESHWSDNTAWASRAWTLQEYVISHRKLIFTADQVYWWCQEASWRESIYLASHTHRYQTTLPRFDMPLTDMHTLPMNAFLTKSEPKYLSKFSEIVEQYSGRKLTVQGDRLYAFQGVLNAIKAADPRKDHFWALTTWNFELELDWGDADNYSSEGEFSPVAAGMFPSWSWLSYPGPVAMGWTTVRVICFRFFYDPSKASLECKRVSAMKTRGSPADISMIKIRAQFSGVTLNPDRQIIFETDIVRLGVKWNRKLDLCPGRPLTGYEEELMEDRSSLDQEIECCLLAWSAKIDKTKTQYDFVSINPCYRGDPSSKSIWMLKWRNGIAIRAGHGVIRSKVWNSLGKERHIIVME